MTRTRAREAAVRLICAQAASGLAPDGLVEEYFEPEHLASLAGGGGRDNRNAGPMRPSSGYIKRVVRARGGAPRWSWTGYIRRHAPRLEAGAHMPHGRGRAQLRA